MTKRVTMQWDLEHCPFCGEQENLQIDEAADPLYAVHCRKCDCEGPNEKTYTKAVESWNYRC
jgi:Lar family restriction alleviation protein